MYAYYLEQIIAMVLKLFPRTITHLFKKSGAKPLISSLFGWEITADSTLFIQIPARSQLFVFVGQSTSINFETSKRIAGFPLFDHYESYLLFPAKLFRIYCLLSA